MSSFGFLSGAIGDAALLAAFCAGALVLVICRRLERQNRRLGDAIGNMLQCLRRLIQHRKNTGLLKNDVDAYCRRVIDGVRAGKSGFNVPASDGRIVLAKNAPLPSGGWVSTHEDVTEQRSAEEERMATKVAV